MIHRLARRKLRANASPSRKHVNPNDLIARLSLVYLFVDVYCATHNQYVLTLVDSPAFIVTANAFVI